MTNTHNTHVRSPDWIYWIRLRYQSEICRWNAGIYSIASSVVCMYLSVCLVCTNNFAVVSDGLGLFKFEFEYTTAHRRPTPDKQKKEKEKYKFDSLYSFPFTLLSFGFSLFYLFRKWITSERQAGKREGERHTHRQTEPGIRGIGATMMILLLSNSGSA